VALSLSDAFCVERHRAEFRALVRDQVDILFGNETEIASLYQAPNLEAAVEQLRAERVLGVVTLGAAGSLAASSGEVVRVPAEPVAQVVDTTGAGDLYAAGFLHGLTRGQDLRTCCRLGALAAAEVISHYGARPRRSLAAHAEEILGRPL
jgi:sugar/nucleoside kinase (ribokinase family)